MTFTHRLRRLALGVLTGGAIVMAVLSAPVMFGALTPAAAQISEDAQIALEDYGRWRPHPRFGEVWVPSDVPREWRPYQYGHWVYTEEWGWYWVSDAVEADWGWVVYHYGRWAFERGFGWFWVPGDEWAPAWVDWRYGEGGEDYVGWAPLPPDALIETYVSEPAYWVFVPGRYMMAPRWRAYAVPPHRRVIVLRSTRIVNRTFGVRGARLAVNPGISPAFVARVTRAPVATYRVQPRVFAATQGVSGAVQIRRDELRAPRTGRPGGPSRLGTISVQRTTTVVQPSATAVAPQPLGKNESGRLGSHPPRAAQGGAAPQQQQAPAPQAPSPLQRQAPAVQQRAPGATPSPPPSGPAPTTTTPAIQQQPPATTTAPSSQPPAVVGPAQRQERREDRRDLRPPAGAGGGTPPAVRQGTPSPPPPTVVRPIPPQGSPPPQGQRQLQQPPQIQQRQIQQPPPAAARPAQPAAPVVRQPAPPTVRSAPPPAAARPAPPPKPVQQPQQQKKPPPKPGEKPEPPK